MKMDKTGGANGGAKDFSPVHEGERVRHLVEGIVNGSPCDDSLMVKCPEEEGAYFFPWVCRERKLRGLSACVECSAPDTLVSMNDIVFG